MEGTDQLVRLTRIRALTEVVFGDRNKADCWLRTALPVLGGTSPLHVARTETGARIIEQILARIDWELRPELNIDAFAGVSGAACRLPALDTVLINRREPAGRRHFDLAHELFHILTWDTMPPEHVEDAAEQSRNRVEQLANSFASALLMPAAVLDRFGTVGARPRPPPQCSRQRADRDGNRAEMAARRAGAARERGGESGLRRCPAQQRAAGRRARPAAALVLHGRSWK